jgi:hypothetical protein
MAKGQKRSNKEARKPKQKKEAAAPAALQAKGSTNPIGVQKKKS